MIKHERSIFINLLKLFFIIINFFIPAIVILWGSSEYGPFVELPVLKSITFILLFFLVFPVTITYLIVSLNRIFPDNIKHSLIFFVPYILNLLIYSIKFGFSEGFLYLWMIQSLPLFLGYILALMTGLLILVRIKYHEFSEKKFYRILSVTAFTAVLMSVFMFCWYYMFRSGINLILDFYVNIEAFTAIIYFTFSILMVLVFHLSLLKTLYKEGKL